MCVRESVLCPGQGADYVEFDVQLTRDLVPVVYHDFTVCTTLAKVGQVDREGQPALSSVPCSEGSTLGSCIRCL